MRLLWLLRQRQIALLWGGQVFSSVGDYLYEIAVVWMAVQVAGGDAGFVVGAGMLARFGCGLLGGVTADRWDRCRTMICVDLLRAGVVLLPLVLARGGDLQIWHLFIIVVIVDGLTAFFEPALQMSLPALVRQDDLYTLNGLMDGTRRLARALGPGAAGLLVVLLPLPHFFTLNAVSYLFSAASVLLIGRHFAWRADAERAPFGPHAVLREIAAAVVLVRGQRALTYAISTNMITNVGWSAAFTVGTPLLAQRVLGGGVGTYGTIAAAYGVGSLVGTVVVSLLPIRRPLLALSLSQVLHGAGFLLMACATTIEVAVAGAALSALGGPMGNVVLLTMIQRLPADRAGKVFALRLTTATAGQALGLLLAGPLYMRLPVPVGIALCALLIMLAGLVGVLRFANEDADVREACVVQEPSPSAP